MPATEFMDLFDGFEPTDSQAVAGMGLEGRIERAVALLREHEPPEGYYLAFSGGKDSCVIKELARLAGVKFESWYNNTTIDPPELIRFIRTHHPDARWNNPKHGNMLHRIATANKIPPTRRVRWCCEEYKEWGGPGRFKVIGVRAEESSARRKWKELAEDLQGNRVLCPIVYWSSRNAWEFIRSQNLPYCSLYDEGMTRIGCVGCPLNDQSRDREFLRWPKYAEKWKAAVIANWEKWHTVPREDGKPRMQSRYASGEDFWHWYVDGYHASDVMRECQSGMLWTNEETDDNQRTDEPAG
jgi:phosphoadenosine phosphosulfate reductase